MSNTSKQIRHFDAVIVGSGFGGSVVAERLSSAGWTVCVLERGKKYPPGSFPRTPSGVKNNIWDPSKGSYGLFNLWSFRKIDALVSSGLGGGSLIYANVLLRKDEKWFHETHADGSYTPWPIDRATLDPHYDRAEKILNAQKYPFDKAPYDQTCKTREFKKAAESRGLDWSLPPLAVTFANESEEPQIGHSIKGESNLHNAPRQTCRLCGECDIGCNYGSKNTLDFNYLSMADRNGAEIYTLSEVTDIKPSDGGGFGVTYTQHDESQLSSEAESIQLSCNKLIISAGTLGTNFLLQKNLKNLQGINKSQLGKHFCGNGDLLSFAYKCGFKKDGKKSPLTINPNYGPVITSTIRSEKSRGYYIQDAGYPAFVSWILERSNPGTTITSFFKFLWLSLVSKATGDTDLSSEFQALLGNTDMSESSLPLLGMGRDVPDGELSLNSKNRLESNWSIEESSEYFQQVKNTMEEINDSLGGKFIINPTWYLRRLITVHPLGGCAMSNTAEDGVVNSFGEVHGVPDLIIADGSIMPGPIGPNPSLTIAAMAERISSKLLGENH